MELGQRQGKKQPASRAGNLRYETEEMDTGRRRAGENKGGVFGLTSFVDFSRPVRSVALKNQLYAAVGALLLIPSSSSLVIKEVKPKVEEEEEDKHGDDCELDLLYIVHSDISSLLRQVNFVCIMFLSRHRVALNHGDSVMDTRQFLLDAPGACYFTRYELLLFIGHMSGRRNKARYTASHLQSEEEMSGDVKTERVL
ncbi:hypothetical protein Bca52824_025172 [Brassica carinata]|uniref:Uncharacterized protein n=1 Tax=Brassica carinata TaxID=52824 RepID=A0A8X8AVG8_BRACI|nr:hypothetical protein Bca52824_025172 [Brassica carinata]